MIEVSIGATATVSTVVTAEQTAVSVGSGSLPVFATPMMVALMERAACDALAPFLEAGETSVGTGLSISHDAPTLVGSVASATAVVTAVDRRAVTFELTVTDATGRVIGQGSHTRFIVDGEKFLAKAGEKKEA